LARKTRVERLDDVVHRSLRVPADDARLLALGRRDEDDRDVPCPLALQIRAAVSNPLSPGMCTSSNTSEKLVAEQVPRASSPEPALTMRSPRDSRTASSATRFARLSSTIRISGMAPNPVEHACSDALRACQSRVSLFVPLLPASALSLLATASRTFFNLGGHVLLALHFPHVLIVRSMAGASRSSRVRCDAHIASTAADPHRSGYRPRAEQSSGLAGSVRDTETRPDVDLTVLPA